MPLSKPKHSKLNLSTSGILLPYMPSKQPIVTWKNFGFALAHLSTSNSFALPLTNIIPLILLLRNASTPLLLFPPLQTLANFGIPSTLSSSVNLLLFFLHYHCHRCSLLSSQTKFSNCIPLLSLRLIPCLKTLLAYLALFLWSLKMKCLKSSLTHLTLSMILIPFPRLFSKQCLSALLPTLTNIINLSLISGTFPDQFKSCSVIPLLKKYNLDKEDLSNYRLISHLSFLSKLTECVNC